MKVPVHEAVIVDSGVLTTTMDEVVVMPAEFVVTTLEVEVV